MESTVHSTFALLAWAWSWGGSGASWSLGGEEEIEYK